MYKVVAVARARVSKEKNEIHWSPKVKHHMTQMYLPSVSVQLSTLQRSFHIKNRTNKQSNANIDNYKELRNDLHNSERCQQRFLAFLVS